MKRAHEIYYTDAKLAADGILEALGYNLTGGEWKPLLTNSTHRVWYQRFVKNTPGGMYYELRQNGRKHYIWEIEIADAGYRYRFLESINIDLLNTPQENIDLVLLSKL